MYTYKRLVEYMLLLSRLTELHIWSVSTPFECIYIYESRWFVRLINHVKVSRFHLYGADVLGIN